MPTQTRCSFGACVREAWTEQQVQIARAFQEEGVQNRVAERYGVSKPTVSELLSAGYVHEVRDAEHALAAMLEDGLTESE